MMGHHKPEYRPWIEAAGYAKTKDLLTYEVDIAHWEDPKINRLIAAGERNPHVHIRMADKSKFAEEARTILNILNEAWSDNWGYVPLTEAEIAYAGKKLKPIIYNELVRVAELDGEPVAFMLTIPDINELIKDLNGTGLGLYDKWNFDKVPALMAVDADFVSALAQSLEKKSGSIDVGFGWNAREAVRVDREEVLDAFRELESVYRVLRAVV